METEPRQQYNHAAGGWARPSGGGGIPVPARRNGSRWDVAVGAEESLLGKIGRVTVSIPADGPGEVLLTVRGGTEAFAAWSDEPIMRHRRVVVVDSISARSVFVTPVP
jgi:hypothetical protein